MANLVPWNKCSLEVGDIPVAIISLEDAQRRRSTLIERGFPSDLVNGFWPACDMRDLPGTELQSYKEYHDIKRIYGRPPVSAELGCLFSHSAIIKWLAKQDVISSVIIFEDDVVPEELNGFEKLIKLAEGLSDFAKLGKPFICHLGPRPEQWKFAFTRRIHKELSFNYEQDLFNFVDAEAKLWRAHAYIISKGAAEEYVKVAERTGFLADDWQFIVKQTKSKLIFVNPPLFTQDEQVESTIDPGKEREVTDIRQVSNDSRLLRSVPFEKNVIKTLRVIKLSLKALVFSCFRALPGKKFY
nr:glycosyltransferase family 25 protein [Halomonas sp. UBA3074]